VTTVAAGPLLRYCGCEQELLGLLTDARVGGMLSGKVGLVHFHTGSAASRLDPLWAVMEASKGAIPITQMLPTHISGRGPGLLQVSFSCLNLLIEVSMNFIVVQ
jgi:hypothetical protein